MKKIISLSLSVLFIFMLSYTAFAAQQNEIVKRETYSLHDGNYVVIETAVFDEVEQYNLERSNRSAEKKYTYNSPSGGTLWTFTLRATFSYNGRTSSVVGSSTSYSIKHRDWSCDDHYAEDSGNTAYGYGSFSSPVDSKDVTLSLTCDKNGNIR